MQAIAQKVRHVLRGRQTRDHTCHWPGCTKNVPPAMCGCKPHWFALPKPIRDEIWRTYRVGQEVNATPSLAYVAAADAAQDWIRTQLPPGAPPPKEIARAPGLFDDIA